MSSRGERFDRVADRLKLSGDHRASLLVLHEDEYLTWLGEGIGLEIKEQRLIEITETLELLSVLMLPDAANQWLRDRNDYLDGKIPGAVLRVGKVRDVRALVEAMSDGVML